MKKLILVATEKGFGISFEPSGPEQDTCNRLFVQIRKTDELTKMKIKAGIDVSIEVLENGGDDVMTFLLYDLIEAYNRKLINKRVG